MRSLHFQIPIFVLNHDRHLVGETLVQMRWNYDTGGLCLECNVKMVIAGKPARRNIAKHTTHHRAQCFLHHVIVRNQAVGMIFAHWRLVDCEAC